MRKIKLFFVFIIFFGISGTVSDEYLICSTGKLYVGTARMDITPPAGIKMAGYSSRGSSREIHDPLYAKVLVLEVDGYRTAIISWRRFQPSATNGILISSQAPKGVQHVEFGVVEESGDGGGGGGVDLLWVGLGGGQESTGGEAQAFRE